MTVNEAKKQYQQNVEHWEKVGQRAENIIQASIKEIQKAIKSRQTSAEIELWGGYYKASEKSDVLDVVLKQLTDLGYTCKVKESSERVPDYNWEGGYIGDVTREFTVLIITGWA